MRTNPVTRDRVVAVDISAVDRAIDGLDEDWLMGVPFGFTRSRTWRVRRLKV